MFCLARKKHHSVLPIHGCPIKTISSLSGNVNFLFTVSSHRVKGVFLVWSIFIFSVLSQTSSRITSFFCCFISLSVFMLKVSKIHLYASLLLTCIISQTLVIILPANASWLVLAMYLLSPFLPIKFPVKRQSIINLSWLSNSQLLPTAPKALIITSLKSSLSTS